MTKGQELGVGDLFGWAWSSEERALNSVGWGPGGWEVDTEPRARALGSVGKWGCLWGGLWEAVDWNSASDARTTYGSWDHRALPDVKQEVHKECQPSSLL